MTIQRTARRSRVGARRQVDHQAAAELMRRRPGVWVLVCVAKDRQAATSQVWRIERGKHVAYRGRFEARIDRDEQGEPQVWARWMGES